MTDINKILELARSQLGVKEAPAGSNRVKYNTAYYGREVSGGAYPWCCAFIWWLFREAGAPELFYGGGKTASCTTLYNWYRRQGQAVEKAEIRPGDLVFFNFDGNPAVMNHIGICESVEPGYVTTIDGNTGTTNEANGGAVMRRRRALRYVGGAARPAYTEEEEGMKLYRYVAEMPEWAREAATKAINNGLIKMDEHGAVGVWEANLQALVWMDRLGLLDKPAVR
ncbi:CHAP domain-containing protein [Pseudoflavonifractor phocaeensis]|uniref:CHAP domain-containing protein n=1 Tax=Pseudoflavonifractor phocaeensis TaxID=1870988 RepID=UPI00313C4AE2